MKIFQFSMQNILNVRNTLREVREADLAEARAALAAENERLSRIDGEIRSALSSERIPETGTGFYLLQREKYVRRLKEIRKVRRLAVETAEKRVTECIRALQYAMTEMKKMEKCRERELERWQVDFRREEQKQNDEAANTGIRSVFDAVGVNYV
jgi:flagellar export protein FliJ